MPRDVRINDLFRLILPGSPAVSPCGKQVVFCVKRLDPKENRYTSHLYLMPVSGGRPRQLTRGLVLDSSPTWSPKGDEIAFVSDRAENSNVWVLPLAGGELRQVTQLDGGAISSLSWSPDGREFLFQFFSMPKQTDDEKKRAPAFKHITELTHKLDGFGYFRGESWTIYRASASTGKATALTPGDQHDSEPSFSPDGKKIVFMSTRGEDRHKWADLSEVYVMDRTGKNVREVSKGRGSRECPRFGPSGEFVYWVGYDGGPGEWLRHEHSIWKASASGKGKPVELNPGHDRWVMNMVGSDTCSAMSTMMEPYVDGNEERVAFGSDEDGCYRLYSCSSAGGEVRVELGGKISVLAFSVGDGSRPEAVCAVATMRDTGELVRTSLDGSKAATQLTKLTAPFFKPLRYNEPEEFWFKNGKTHLQGWVLKPPGFRKGKKYPCLFEVHGGPMTQYGEAFFLEMQILAAKGWVVAFCNPRGSSGRGMEFANCIEGKWGQDDWSDVQALVKQLSKEPYVDTQRLGILGGSYGGFMTTWAVSHSKQFKAAVTQRQAGDFHVMYGSSDFGHYDSFVMGGTPWDQPMRYHEDSPNFHVKKIKTPLLIIHSEQDLRCPIAQAYSLFTSMKVLDQAPCEMVAFEGESHGLSRGGRPLNREERLKRIVDWFERYL